MVTMKSFRWMLLVLYLSMAASRKNGWAPRWMVDLLCTESSGLTQVPWDCTGYLHCYTQGSMTYGVWLNCPANLQFDQASSNCLRYSSACVSMAEKADKYCPRYPSLKFPHPESCAMFYDCSRKTPNATFGLKIYENECHFPSLFSTILETCTDNMTDNNVRCSNAPATKCDYRTECITAPRTCAQDGYAPTPGTVLSREYVECQAGKIKATLKCESSPEIFDPIQKACTSNILQSVDVYCSANPTARFSDPANCARYYDCTVKVHNKGLNPYQSECQYLYLHDEARGNCTLFYKMTKPCGNKLEPKAPCDYRIGHCVDRPYCMACSASCVGQPDGKVPYPGIPSTRYHLVCRDERTMDIDECQKGYIFDTKVRGCIPDIDETTSTEVTKTASTTTPSTTDSSTTMSATASTTSVRATTTDTATDATSTPSKDQTSTTSATVATSTTASTDATSTVASLVETTTVDDATSTAAPFLQTEANAVCPCENLTSLAERLDNLTSITNSLAEQLQVTVRSPFDCVAPPVPMGTVAQINYEGSLAVARYTCAVEGEVLCPGFGVSKCAGGDTWTPGPRCGRAVWQNMTESSITLDCPPAAHGSLWFTVGGVNDFSVKLEEDDAVLLSFQLNLTEGMLFIVNGTGNTTLNMTRTSPQTDWTIYFNNDTLDLYLEGVKQGDVFFPQTNFTGVWRLTVVGNGKLQEVLLKPPGSPLPSPRATPETSGAAETSTNLALRKPAFASAYMNDLYKLETIVDGIKDNNVNDNDCFMTAVMKPWVMVDLGALYRVTAIILTRSDSFISRLRNIQILVYTQNPEVIPTAAVKSCAVKPGQLLYREIIPCGEPVIGRFVRVEYFGVRDILTICEMEVFGAKVTGWSPFLCPEPPLLDKAMVDVHYSLTAAVAVYTCNDGYCDGCDNSNMIYCTSEKGWEGRPRGCIKVDSGTENTIGRVEIPCPLKIGFAHELWVEPKESGSFMTFQVGVDTLLLMNIMWSSGVTEITFSNRINGVIRMLSTDSRELFKNDTVAHVVVLFLSDHYQFLVDNQPLIAVPHMTSSPHIDVINGFSQKIFIKRVQLNQDWRRRVVRGNHTNLSFGKSTLASSYVEASSGVVDGSATYTTLLSTCWQAVVTDEAPFWQVDTGGYYHINGVMISARNPDGCLSNCDTGLHDFALDVYMTNPRHPGAKPWLCQFYNGYVPFSASEFIRCRQENVGRYVILRATRKTGPEDLFTVCELEVWGTQSVMKAMPVNTWTPRECPMPPVLDNMSVQLSYTLNSSVATYTCHDNYTVCSDDDNSVLCESEMGWKGEPSPCVKIVESVSGDNSSVIFGCPFKLGTRIQAWLKPNGSLPRYHINLETSNSTEVMVGLSFDSVTGGQFLTLYNGNTEEVVSADVPALQGDAQYQFVFTYYSDYIQATVDGVLIREFPHYQMSHRIGSMSVSGLTIQQVGVTMNKDAVKDPVPSNLAQNRPATSSSSSVGTQPGFLVDGSGNLTTSTCWSHVDHDTAIFWEVDLQGYYYIRDIVITSDAKPHDFEISVRVHSGGDKVCVLYKGVMEPETTERLVCEEQVLGRYVKIVPKARADNTDILSFCEVEVYGSSLKPTAWSPFQCGPPPVDENSVTSLTYSATQAVATYTCRDNYTTCDDVNVTVMTCSSGQHWKGTPIKCVQNVFEYTERVLEFRPTCELTVFSSLEVWATPSSGMANLSLQIGNNTITFSAEMNPNDSTLIGSVIFGNQISSINTSLPSPGPEHYFVFTIRPDSITIEIDKTEVSQLPHIYDTLRTNSLQFENIAPRRIKMNIGSMRGIQKVPLIRNMALGKRAEASTGVDRPSLVVDGIDTTCWQTAVPDFDPWWQVDLQGYYSINRVVIHRFSKCSDCGKYRHNLQIEVYKTDPNVQADSDFSICNTYMAESPFPMKTDLKCLSECFGRFVRIKRLTTPGLDDVMALCEVEVFVSKLVKGPMWTPFSCPSPPLADINPLRMSYTTTEATATYQCQDGFSVCGGSDVIKCNSSAGWSTREMSCKQTTFEEPGEFLGTVLIQCPLTVGDVLEVWMSSTESEDFLMLEADSMTALGLSYTKATNKLRFTHSSFVLPPYHTTAEHSPPLVAGQEWHLVIAFLSEHILVEINGIPVMTYPHYIPLNQVRSVSSLAGFKLRKVSMSKWRHAFLEPPLVNLARDKTCTASSNPHTAMVVVDGNDRDDWMSGSCWSATPSSDPVWWQVDLGGYYIVTKTEISSIKDCSVQCNVSKQLHDFSVDVFMNDPTTTTTDPGRRCYTYDGSFPPGTTESLVCESPTPGRYTRLTRHRVRPEDEFAVCEVKVYGNKVIKKNSGPYDCVLPPPPLDGANAQVEYTDARMQVTYTCKTGYAPCALESPTRACAGGLWQAIKGSCYQIAYRYPLVSSSKSSFLLNCPMVYSTRFHIFATPTLGKDMYISIRQDGKTFLRLQIFFNHRYYQNVSRIFNNKEDIQSDVFPFVIGEEFHVVISYFTDSFNIEVNSLPLLTAVPSTIHDGVVPEVAFWGPMAVRELRFEMPSEVTYYKDMHAKSEDSTFVELPVTMTETAKYFRVKACKDVVLDVKGGLFLTDHVQVTLGARENTKTDCTVCPGQRSVWHSPLSCHEYKTFWLDWSNGLDLKIGAGSVLGTGLIMEVPFSSDIAVLGISGTKNVINVDDPETCGRPESPPLNMAIDKYERQSRESTSVSYTCVDQTYVFCGLDNVANCTKGVVGSEVKGECRKMTWQPDNTNFTAFWPCRVTEGSTLSLYLNESRAFSVQLGDFWNTLLRLDASSSLSNLTVGHKPKSGLEIRENIPNFSFTTNKKFHMTVTLSNRTYKISVDGVEVATYTDALDYTQVAYVIIQADNAQDVRIFTPENGYKDCTLATVPNGSVQRSETSVGAEGTVTCHSGYSFCGTSTNVTCWSDGTWRFKEPMHEACQRNNWTDVPELTQETDFGVPCELTSTTVINLQAAMNPASQAFQMQLVADKETVLRITYIRPFNRLTTSTLLGLNTVQSETIPNHSFIPTGIDLTIVVTPTAFNISLSGGATFTSSYESPLRNVKLITVSSRTRITSLTVLDKQ